MERKTITVKEMAATMGISKTTAYSLCSSPDFFPVFRIGRKVLIDADSLNEWIRQKREGRT